MIIPYRTNIRPYRTPYMNYALILGNVLIFLLSYGPLRDAATGQAGWGVRAWANSYALHPLSPQLFQFISYAFLHGSLLHIGGNMFFLYLFGDNVNDKLGNFNYLCFYLAGGIFSGLGHMAFSNNPVLGASGAVAAVTGAYLVLFPKSLVTVLYWFFFIGTIDVPAIYFIAVKAILIDNILFRQAAHIAYEAHLSGYAFGILAVMGLLASGIVSSSQYDLWAMLKQWNRRRVFRDTVRSGYDPFTGTKEAGSAQVKCSAAEARKIEKIMEMRAQIASFIAGGNVSAAADKYLELMQLDSSQLLQQQYLLDIANQLMAVGRHAESAHAYESFLANYGGYPYIEQVELMLGILYSRYLGDADAAKKHLENARQKLHDPGQLRMCEAELVRLNA